MDKPSNPLDFDGDEDLDLSPRPHVKPARIARGLARELKREARYYAKLVPEILADIGLDHWIRKENRPSPIQRVLFDRRSRQKVRILCAAYNETNIYLRIDPLRLPYQVTIPKLQEDEVLETLSVACGCKVSFQLRDYAKGAWFVVHRDGVLASIPREFPFRDAINSVKDSARPLVFCAGVGENMKLLQPDIEEMPHCLIAGSPGMGKSVCLNSLICQLMWRNSPELVRFVLVDLKGGMELQDYRESSYLWKPIVTTIEDVVPVLQEFKTEMLSRQKTLAAAGARSLREYNAHRTYKMPYILLIIDELAEVLRNPQRQISTDVMIHLGSILSVARATGGHCILCTQRPSTDVIDGYLKATINGRIAFGMPTDADSRVVLDRSDASDIDLPGRAWMLYGAKYTQIQAPWISPRLIKRIIAEVEDREKKRRNAGIGVEDIVKLSLSRLNGSLSQDDLKRELGDRIGWADLKTMLSDIEGEVVTDGMKQYEVLPSYSKFPRRLREIVFEDQPITRETGDSASWDDNNFAPETVRDARCAR